MQENELNINFIITCAWCKEYIKLGNKWLKMKPEDIKGYNKNSISFSHGICTNCYDKEMKKHKENKK